MTEIKDDAALTEILFIQFISGLYTSTMHQLGKLMNPMTGKVETNLEAASATIELLRMLKEKTKGNLSKKESEAIGNALANMQMNYVDELERVQKGSAKKEEDEQKPEKKKEEGKETKQP